MIGRKFFIDCVKSAHYVWSMRQMAGISSLVAVVLFCTGTAVATQITFREDVSPTASYQMNSTYVRSDDAAGTIHDNENAHIVGTTVTPAIIRSLHGYDLSAIPAGSTITGVNFLMVPASTDSTSTSTLVPLEIHLLDSSFSETAATYANQPTNSTLLSTLSVNPRSVTGGTAITWPSSAAFVTAAQNALDTHTNLNFTVRRSDAGEATSIREIFFFVSDDPSNAGVSLSSNSPALIIDYTPEPSAAGMLLVVGAFAAARRRRRVVG